MRIPGASKGLARAGYVFGRKVFPEPPNESYAILGTIYHEMTHVWYFLLRDILDNTNTQVRALWAHGVVAYQSAKGVKGTDFSDRPGTAFTEAAAYYVGDRIYRWLSALDDLDLLWRAKPSDNDSAMLAAIAADYDRYVPVYGKILHDGISEDIESPELSPALRDAINEKVLDGSRSPSLSTRPSLSACATPCWGVSRTDVYLARVNFAQERGTASGLNHVIHLPLVDVWLIAHPAYRTTR